MSVCVKNSYALPSDSGWIQILLLDKRQFLTKIDNTSLKTAFKLNGSALTLSHFVHLKQIPRSAATVFFRWLECVWRLTRRSARSSNFTLLSLQSVAKMSDEIAE
jgi:hypothetical protein